MTRGSIQARGCVLPTDVLLYLCFRVTGAKLRPRSVGFCDSCPINPDASTQAHLQEQGLTLIKKKKGPPLTGIHYYYFSSCTEI